MKRSGMPRPTSCDLSHVINLNKETESNEDTEPGHCRKHIVVCSCPPLGTLTTRMPVLWLCVGKCGTGIGVVYGGLFFIPLRFR